tara:strand:+ start:3389 stop:4486 length:1098 start_codon:yes stop_codon:yes gene_type:complete
MKKRIFFLVLTKHEFYEVIQIIKNLNLEKYILTILIEDNSRNKDLDLNAIPKNINIILVESINYSKNIFKSILQKKKIIDLFKKLKLNNKDLFIYFYNSSLLFFLLQNIFKNKDCKNLMLLTSGFCIPRKEAKIDVLKTIQINLLGFPIIYKSLQYSKFQNTVFKNIKSKDNVDYIVTLNNHCEIVSKINSWDIQSYFPKKDFENKTQDKHLIILSSFWIDKYSKYNLTIKKLIDLLGRKNILVKDHSMSDYSNKEIMQLYDITSKSILNKEISLENYIEKNLDSISSVYGPTSASLKYSSFMGIPTYCFSSIFMDKENIKYTEEYFKFNNVTILKNLNNNTYEDRVFEAKKLPEIKQVINYILN